MLDSADHAFYRSATIRLCHFALDRLDLRFFIKRAGTLNASTDSRTPRGAQRVARYLIGHGRLVQEFVRQVEELSHVVVFTDSDHASCLKTRKNTSSSSSSSSSSSASSSSSSSSSKLFYGSHMLCSTSTTQRLIALSSGNSEFYVLVKETVGKLGAVSMHKHLGVDIGKNT